MLEIGRQLRLMSKSLSYHSVWSGLCLYVYLLLTLILGLPFLMDSSTGNCRLGWQVCDAENSIIESSSSYWRFVTSALVAKTLAVKAALVAAVSLHVNNINMFSDYKNLINLLKTQRKDVVIKGVLHDIVMLAHSFTSITFYYVPHLANVCTNLLAKGALSLISSSAAIVE